MWSISFIILLTSSYSMAQNFYTCDISDYTCITNVLADNSACTTGVYHTVPSTITSLDIHYEIPSLNSSYTDQYSNTMKIGQCFVIAFYFNVTANVGVLSIECPNLEIESYTAINFHKPRQQDVVYYTKISSTYQNIRFTANLVPADDIDLCNAMISTYLTQKPIVKYTPKGATAAQYIQKTHKIYNYLEMYAREYFLSKASFVYKTFVNSILCDFRC